MGNAWIHCWVYHLFSVEHFFLFLFLGLLKEDGNKSRQFTISLLRYIDIMTIIYLLKSRICFHYIFLHRVWKVFSLFFGFYSFASLVVFSIFFPYAVGLSLPSKYILCNFPLNFTNQKTHLFNRLGTISYDLLELF